MDKASIYELQKIDCNCNDCFFMARDFETYKKQEQWHKELQEADFKIKQSEAFRVAMNSKDEKAKKTLMSIAKKMRFSFDKKGLLQYGKCKKFKNQVSFLPGTCQLETQDCFLHRKDSTQ